MLDADGTGNNLIDLPDGTFTWERGNIDKSRGLRLRVQIPDGVKGTGKNAGRQLTVTDIFDTDTQSSIRFGAQIADYITMSVNGVVIPGGKPAAPLSCPGKTSPSNGDGLTISSLAAGEEAPVKFVKLKTRVS
jgi:hypothetical protein